ncbi:MAG: ABC transporter permease, partial [Pseudomonadota bacterium]
LDAFSGLPQALALAFAAPGEVVVGLGAGAAEPTSVVLDGKPYPVALALEGLDPDLVLTDIGTAQQLLGRDDEALDLILTAVVSPQQQLLVWSDRLLPGLSAGFPLPEWSSPGWDVQTLTEGLPSLSFARSVLFNLGALGSLALVVAWLLVFQVSVIWLRRRHPSYERLRQMGVTDRELLRGFLLGVLGLGLLASLAGLWLGGFLAERLAAAVTGYGAAGESGVALDGYVVTKALGSALLVCLFGGWLAFRREAQAELPTGASRPQGRRGLVVLLLAGAGLAGLYATEAVIGAFLAIAAVSLVVLLGVAPLLEALRRFSARFRGRLLERIGLRELVWYPADLAVALGALVLAVATSVAIGLMVDSFRKDFAAMLDQRMIYDAFLDGAGVDLTPLAAELRAVPGVTRIQPYGRIDERLEGRLVTLAFTPFDAFESRRYGLEGSLAPEAVLLNERFARGSALAPGDRFEIKGTSLVVAGIFPGFGEASGRIVLDSTTAERLGVPLRYDRLSVNTDDLPGLEGALGTLAPTLELQDQQSVRQLALDIFDETFAITRALTLLALVVASVGLYNALLALELLRTRSRQLLDAMGVSKGEQRRIAAARIAGVGTITLLLALPLGLVMGWLLCAAVNPRAFGWSLNLTLSADAFGWPLLTALLAMALIALLPVPAEGNRDGNLDDA